MKIRVSLKCFVADYRNIKFALRAVPTKNILSLNNYMPHENRKRQKLYTHLGNVLIKL